MMKKYLEPEVEVRMFAVEDVITASPEENESGQMPL